MTIIIDSNFLFALKAKRDKNHSRAIEILNLLEEKYKKLKITSWLVVGETLTLAVSRFNGETRYIEVFYKLFWSEDTFFEIIQFNFDEYAEIYNILKKYSTPDRLLSFVDASLIFLYKKMKAEYILSFDSHFDTISNRMF